MRRVFRPPLRDKQQDPPFAYCDNCGGEIYEERESFNLFSVILCRACEELEEQEEEE